eukprot:scaffold31669_cov31-Phaeocystis_antarctica.AAC.3
MGSCCGREGAAAHQQVALGLLGGEHGGIGSYRANSRGRSGAEGDGEEQEHVPRGEQLAGENAGRQQIAVTRRREREKSLYTYPRKQGQKPNVF